MSTVLVVYATTYGSTRDVAEAVAETLRAGGVEADLRDAGDGGSLDGYAAVVLGGALYYFRWHRDARRFLKRQRRALAAMPVAVFAMGPFNDTDEEFDGARGQLDRALAKQPWLQPRAKAVFGGRFEPSTLRFPHSNPAMKKLPPSDIRDWAAIKAWAETLPTALGLEGAAAGA